MLLYDSARPGLQPTQTAALAIVTGGAIPTSLGGAAIPLVRLAPAAAVTGVILQSGIYNGQMITLVNESIAASSVTFAAAPGGGVADGAQAIAGLTARTFVWNAAQALWYRAA